MAQTLLLDFGQQSVDSKLVMKNPELALKILISQQSMGTFNKDLLHILITTTMSSNNNSHKRLLYYYFETIVQESSFIMCINQVNKDLSSPNEFVRGFALRLTSKIENFDHINLSLVRDNLKHKCYYVRQNAVHCLTELAIRFEVDVDQDLISLLYKESNSMVVSMIFHSMDRLSINIEEFLNTNYSVDVLELLIDKTDDIHFLKKCIELEFPSVVFKASCKLLVNEETINNDQIISILSLDSTFKADFVTYIDYLTGLEIIEFLTLLDPFEFAFSSKIIDQAIKHVETQDFYRLVDILYSAYIEVNDSSEPRKLYRIMLLDKMTVFTSSHCVYKNEVVDCCLENIISDNPDTVYAGLKFLYAIEANKLEKQTNIIDRLIDALHKMRFGKLVRFTFDIISLSCDKEQFMKLLENLSSDFDKCSPNEDLDEVENQDNANNSSIPSSMKVGEYDAPLYLSMDQEVFLGTHICVSLATMYKKEWDMKAKTIGILLRFIDYGRLYHLMDTSSHSTIVTAIRSLLNNSNEIPQSVKTDYSLVHRDVLDPISFDAISMFPSRKHFSWDGSMDMKETVVQLTGLGEPLYVECNLSYSKYECVLDLLIINQTNSYLQDMGINFTHSKHLKHLKGKCLTSLQPNSAITFKTKFSILESSNCFIAGTILFRYPNEGEYGSRPFELSLGEIKIDIGEFLEGASADFSQNWKKLEWESIYSLTSVFPDMDLVLNNIIKAVNGRLCNKEKAYNFLVANVACFTIKKAHVLINVCLSECKNVEIRVRSVDETIVRSVRDLISDCVKSSQ